MYIAVTAVQQGMCDLFKELIGDDFEFVLMAIHLTISCQASVTTTITSMQQSRKLLAICESDN